MPRETEAHALLALMELTASRSPARRGPNGQALMLPDQNRSLWNRVQVQRGFQALEEAQQLGGGRQPYAPQASIAACNALAGKSEDTEW